MDDTESIDKGEYLAGDEPESKAEAKDEGHDKVPKEFQKQVMEVVNGCSDMDCLNFMQKELDEKRKELEGNKEEDSDVPSDFTDDNMPE